MSRVRAARLLVLLAVLGGAATAIAAVGDPAAERGRVAGPVELRRASPMLKLVNSRRGQAVVSAANMAPGQVRRGRVEVRVGHRARVTLGVDRLGLEPGPAGGRLAEALALRITAIGGGSGRYRTVYDGPLQTLGPLALGRWRARDRYRIRVRVRFAAEPGAQDSLQGGRTAFRLVWRAGP